MGVALSDFLAYFTLTNGTKIMKTEHGHCQ